MAAAGAPTDTVPEPAADDTTGIDDPAPEDENDAP